MFMHSFPRNNTEGLRIILLWQFISLWLDNVICSHYYSIVYSYRISKAGPWLSWPAQISVCQGRGKMIAWTRCSSTPRQTQGAIASYACKKNILCEGKNICNLYIRKDDRFAGRRLARVVVASVPAELRQPLGGSDKDRQVWGQAQTFKTISYFYYSSTSLSLLTYIFHDLGPSPYLGDLLEAELVVEDLDDEVEDIVQDED